jgi:hypothetical protein
MRPAFHRDTEPRPSSGATAPIWGTQPPADPIVEQAWRDAFDALRRDADAPLPG